MVTDRATMRRTQTAAGPENQGSEWHADWIPATAMDRTHATDGRTTEATAMVSVTIVHKGARRTVNESEWQAAVDDMVKTLGAWEPGASSVTRRTEPETPPQPTPAEERET